MILTVDTLLNLAMANPINAEITVRLPDLVVDQCMLTAGCLFQAVWNHQSNLPAYQGLKDYDVFYFDTDLSYEAEDTVILMAERLFQDLGVNVEVKNQAWAHLWYGQRFGRSCPQLHSAKQGGGPLPGGGDVHLLEIATGEVYAPYGVADVEQGLVADQPTASGAGVVCAKGQELSANQ